MNPEQQTELTSIFETYSSAFLGGETTADALIRMKLEHSRIVAHDARLIASMIPLGKEDRILAEMLGLFHDIGRFEQLKKYGTFIDRNSVNHAELGVSVIESNAFFRDLPEDESSILIESIRLHNARNLPDDLSPRLLTFAQLIRDADKLDICRVLYWAWKEGLIEKHPEIMFSISLDGPVSAEVIECIKNGGTVPYDSLKTLSDFFATQLAWVHDINYAATFRLMLDRGLIENISEALAGQAGVDEVVQMCREHAEGMARGR